ncbi:LysR family transcriptional regulator [Vibrio cholerae]
MTQMLFQGVHLLCQVAQYPTISQAASRLNLTPGAISQQVKSIEQYLGFSVFERHPRGIRLTEQGRKLIDGVTPHLLAIEEVTAQVRSSGEAAQIRLKLTPSFAFKWLVPRLESFYRLHPTIQVHTFAEGALVDSQHKDFDIAIDYGPIPYKDDRAELLMAESLLPVMSPYYYQQHFSSHSSNEAWSRVTLLHDAMLWQGAVRDHEWRYWSKQQGMDFDCQHGHFFNRTDMAMSAAEANVGVALARMALLGDEISMQRLVAPYEPIPAGAGYFVLTHVDNAHTRVFKQWLRAQCDVGE